MQTRKVAISATFTAEPVEESLGFWMQELDMPFAIEFAPYNQVFQQLLDPSSLLSTNQSGVNVLLVRFEDWQRFERPNATQSSHQQLSREKIERNASDLVVALKSAAQKTATVYVVVFCPASPAVMSDREVASLVEQMERYVAAEMEETKGVRVVRSAELFDLYPVPNYYDARTDALGHVPFTPLAFAGLGTLLARKIYALSNAPHKVAVLDCDHTLWKGVVAEDGIHGIEIDPARRRLQQFLVEQQRRGMLLCLCSKNNEEDVIGAFQQRTDMPLSLDHITAWKINWNLKSENLKSLARELNLGLDSFIFIDDDPVVCAEAQANCPEVLTIQLPQDVESISGILNHVWAFDRLQVTREDQKRAELYKQNAERESLRKQALSFEDFLAGLSLEIKITEMSEAQLARTSQLTQRTNQFNCATRRRLESEIRSLVESGELECMVVDVSDRFGDYGLVGAMMFRAAQDRIETDTFLLSCRTLGRGVEHRMLARLGQMAERRGLRWVDVNYVVTKKNQPARDFLESIGTEFKQEVEGGFVYRFPAAFAATLAPSLISQPNPADDSSKPSVSDHSAEPLANGARAKSQIFQRICTQLRLPEQVLEAIESKKCRSLSAQTRNFVAPASEAEILLARIWEEILAIEPIGARDNFFELGGTSLGGVRLFAEIEKAFDKSLSLATLFEAPTIEQLARILRREESASKWSSLVAIKAEGAKPPFFCIHAAGGNVLFYRDLAMRLDPGQPLYGLQAQGLNQKKLSHNRVEQMAAHYIEEMLTLQPEGPYYIGGACFGGLVAYEIAQQLHAKGRKVGLLALFNTNGPGYPKLQPGAIQAQAKLYGWLRRAEHHWGSLMLLPPRQKLGYLMSKSNKAGRLVMKQFHLRRKALLRRLYKRAERPLPQALAETQNNIQEAQKQYHPKVYPGRVTLFRASKQPDGIYPDPAMGWGELAAGGLEIHEVPGYHAAIIAEPRVQFTAAIVNDCLRKAQALEQEEEALSYSAVS